MFTFVDWLARLEMRPGRPRRDHPRRIWQPSKHYTLYSNIGGAQNACVCIFMLYN